MSDLGRVLPVSVRWVAFLSLLLVLSGAAGWALHGRSWVLFACGLLGARAAGLLLAQETRRIEGRA